MSYSWVNKCRFQNF